MELSASTIYFIGLADNIRIALLALSFLCFSAFLIGIAFACTTDSDVPKELEHREKLIRSAFVMLGYSTILFAGWVLIPGSKTLAAMEILPAVVNDQNIKGASKNILELTEGFLKEVLEQKEKE